MPEANLAAGTIEYQDTGGDGPVLVFLHGLTMDGSLWRKVVPGLVPDYRCKLPTLPLGGHRRPMRPGADLSLRGMALLVGEFIERVGLTGVTLVQNDDWGRRADPHRGGRHHPHRAPGHQLVRGVRQLPAATSPAIRRDLASHLTSVPSRPILLEWAGRSATFDRPVLVAWAREDRMMPRRHGRRLADLFPDVRLAEIDDSYTLITEDQPEQLSRAVLTPLARLARRRGLDSRYRQLRRR